MSEKKEIDPTKTLLETPMWVVYGPSCFPTLFCCMVNNPQRAGLTIWGYSVWKRQPGFRTLGVNLQEWRDRPEVKPARFFATQDDALQYLGKITTPRCDP